MHQVIQESTPVEFELVGLPILRLVSFTPILVPFVLKLDRHLKLLLCLFLLEGVFV